MPTGAPGVSREYFQAVKQKTKQICLFNFGRIYGAPICLRVYLTISKVVNRQYFHRKTRLYSASFLCVTNANNGQTDVNYYSAALTLMSIK